MKNNNKVTCNLMLGIYVRFGTCEGPLLSAERIQEVQNKQGLAKRNDPQKK